MNRLKNKIYAFFFWQTRLGEILNKIYDLRIFYKHSFRVQFSSRESFEAWLTKQYHIIEKGLALPNPRPNFGQEKIKHLISHSNAYLDQYGMSELLSTISATLVSYLQENESLYEAEPALYTKMTSFINRVARRPKLENSYGYRMAMVVLGKP